MTVGLVIVSHSEKLALGAVELAQQMAHNNTAIVAAGGLGNNILGTSVETIYHAIETVDSSDGVLILIDMGSAAFSTEMAIERLTEEQRGRVHLSYAPLVEGAVAGAVEAAQGSSLHKVRAVAEQTASKEMLEHIKPITQVEASAPVTAVAEQPEEPLPADALEKQYTLANPVGLHARPSSLIIHTAARFDAIVEIHTNTSSSRADSMSGLLGLAARKGDVLRVRVGGPQAQAALDALDELIQANFYESTEAASSSPQIKEPAGAYAPPAQVENELVGIATSSGFALGPALLYTSHSVNLRTVERRTIDSTQVAAEQARLLEAIDATVAELQTLMQRLQQQIGAKEAAIFDAQILLLRDPRLLRAANALIAQRFDAASAFAQVGEQNATQLASVKDGLLAERAVDIRDVTSRVVQHLGVSTTSHQDFSTLNTPVILIAHDLTPSDTAQLRQDMILGICTTQGGATAHTAILARALGIPAIAGLNETLLQRIHDGEELGMDAEKGILYVQPTSEILASLSQHVKEQTQRLTALKAAQHTQAPLLLGEQRIHLLANVGSAVEATAARQWGAEGIGLLRTEFLFASTQTMPNEAQQYTSYIQVFRAFLGDTKSTTRGPIVVRTLDAGADKPMPAVQPFLSTTKEANPALGVRGLRVHLAHPELLEQQFRALLRAAQDEQVELHIMLPMLTTVEELRTVRTLFERVTTDLHISKAVPLGIMIEVPASVVMAPELAQLADFFSIGANDLLQYTLACDRTNTALSTLYTPLQPSVLRLIRQVAEAGRNAGKPVAVCGEMASDPRLAPVLVGLGVTELSMTPNALPAIRAALTGRTLPELIELANRVCRASTVSEVEQELS